MDSLRKEKLTSRLRSLPAGCHLLYEETCGSTNDLATEAWQSGCAVPCVVLTDLQTNGRGRFDRVWEGRREASLMFSLLFRPDLKTDSFPMLTEVFALAVCSTLEKICGSAFAIKWPNDVVFDSRKVCGILTVLTPDLKAAVIGAGINLKRSAYPPELADKAVSLEEACGSAPDPEELLCGILECFFEKYEVFAGTEDMSGLKEAYESRLVNIGRRVTISDQKEDLAGTAEGIDEKGRLIFRTDAGKIIPVDSGEVSVRGFYGIR